MTEKASTNNQVQNAERPTPAELDFTPKSALDATGEFKNEQKKGTVRFKPRTATVRIIGTEEWGAGVKIKDEVEARWDRSNGWSLPVGQFSDAQLQVLERDGSFEIRR
jgi:hypothetical protein